MKHWNEEGARAAIKVLHRYHGNSTLDQTITRRDLVTGDWRASCGRADNLIEDARAAVEYMIGHFGPSVMILDEIGSPRPAWAWLETIEVMERDAQPYREVFEQWLHDEAARQQREALRTSCAAKYQQAETAAAARRAAEARRKRALQAKETAEALLAQAEADAAAAAEAEVAVVGTAAPESRRRTDKRVHPGG